MKPWLEQCADTIEFLETYFKDEKYSISMERFNVPPDQKQWRLIVKQVRSDGGSHHGSAFVWLSVEGADIEKLPEKLLEKATQRIYEWQKEGLDKVMLRAKELQEAKDALDKRLAVNPTLERLKAVMEKT